MKIKFKEPDPRAGTIAQMDSSRGQHFIDTGAAVLVRGDGSVEAPSPSAPAVTREDLDRALAGLPGENTDADYVVGAMRSYFGALFTDEDEERVREIVKTPAASSQHADVAAAEAPSGGADQDAAGTLAEKQSAGQKSKKTAEPKNKDA